MNERSFIVKPASLFFLGLHLFQARSLGGESIPSAKKPLPALLVCLGLLAAPRMGKAEKDTLMTDFTRCFDQELQGAAVSNRRSLGRQILTSLLHGGLLKVVKVPGEKNRGLEAKLLVGFPPTRRYLVGVSGGRDSVALLHQLIGLGYPRLVVCHLDHQLRGRASAADARFVARLAAKLHCEFEMDRTDVAALARSSKESVETAGRMARYDFFARIARRRRCHTLFLGHHADDLVETFLMNLFRGAGPTGFGGMREIALRQVAGTEIKVVRPLLNVWREEIDKYVTAQRIEFREDVTNESLGPVRNRVRRRLIPYIERQLGRKVRSAVWRAALLAADEAEWLEGLVDAKQSEGAQLDAACLRAQPRALQRRTIHKWLQSRGVGDLDFDLIERVRALVGPDAPTAKTNLPRGRHVRRRAKKLFIE